MHTSSSRAGVEQEVNPHQSQQNKPVYNAVKHMFKKCNYIGMYLVTMYLFYVYYQPECRHVHTPNVMTLLKYTHAFKHSTQSTLRRPEVHMFTWKIGICITPMYMGDSHVHAA